MKKETFGFGFGGLLVLGSSLFGAEPAAPDWSFEAQFQGSVHFGYADGCLQTPNGGQPGTSSLRRPTLHELKIDDALFYDGTVKLQWGRLGVFGGAQFVNLDGSGTLPQSLVSHGVSFAAGDVFRARSDFDWYHAGVGWKFALAGGRLELFPKADAAVLDFSYRLSSASAVASRSYVKAAVRLGAEATYQISRGVSLKLDGAASVPISNTPQIATLAGTVQFNLLPRSQRLKPILFVGGGMEWIDYEDNQRLPNHISLDLGPFVTGGLSLSF